jgi:hypothetical protein
MRKLALRALRIRKAESPPAEPPRVRLSMETKKKNRRPLGARIRIGIGARTAWPLGATLRH